MILIINLKTYGTARGIHAENIAKACRAAGKKTLAQIFLAPQILDIVRTSRIIPTMSQHVDYFTEGRNTGFILPEAVKDAGAVGSILNHSEHALSLPIVKETILRCKKLKLKTVACAATLQQAKAILYWKPDYIAYEVPELIAKGTPISEAKADSVKAFSQLLQGTGVIPLCGAGISTKEDVIKSLSLGCKGVLVASAIAASPHPERVIAAMAGVSI